MTTACTTREVVRHMIRAICKMVPRPSHSRLHNEKLNSRGLFACYFVILIMNGTVLFTGNWRNRHQPPPITHRVVCFVCVLIRSDRRLVGLRVFIKSISLSTKFTQSARFRIRSKNNSTLLFSGKRAQASVEHSKRAQRARSKSHEGCKRRFFTRILQNCFFEFASQCPCHRVRSTPSVNRLPSQRFKNASH